MAVYKLTFTKTNWSGGADAIWYDTVSQSFFGDAECTQEVTAIEPPTRECWRFRGYYSAASGGVQYIDDAGNFTDALLSLSITTNKTFTAQGTQASWKLTLDDNGGAGGSGALYYRIGDGGWFDNHLCEGEPVSAVAKPSSDGYAFAGYYNGTSTPGAQYVDEDGGFTASLDALALTAAKTIYAKWVAPYKIMVSAGSGTGGTTAFYFDSVSGKFYSGSDLGEEITKIRPHTRECFAFAGCHASNNTTSAQRVAPDGTIAADWTPTAAATVYAQWSRVSWKVTLNKSSGTGGAGALYYRIDGGGYYADDLCADAAQSVECPTRSGYVFKGYYSATSGGTQYIDRSGAFLPEFAALAPTQAKTIYAQWKAAHKITLNKSSGTGGTDAIWYSVDDDGFFADAACTTPAASVAPPVRECWRFDGYYNTASGTTQYIDGNGDYTAALSSLSINAAKNFYARWTRVSYKATLDDNGGAGGGGAFYCDGTTASFYADDQLTTPTAAVAVPARAGYDFLGYYATRAGGSRYVSEVGAILATSAYTADITVYARWQGRGYTLAFNYNGGAGETASKQVTMGAAVGALPAATHLSAVLDGWSVDGAPITNATIWGIAHDATAVAVWRYFFGNVTDYFGLQGALLMLVVGSESGEGRRVVNLWNGANEAGPGLLNPVCTYRVIAAGNVTITLGAAWRAGYFITDFEYRTGADKEPLLVVRAAANEGANAINTYPVTFRVDPDHVAQDPFNAVSGGGELVELTSGAKCDPVVPYEDNRPCASDVVHGRRTLSGRTAAYFGENRPTLADGWLDTGVPTSSSDVDFTTYSFSAERSI